MSSFQGLPAVSAAQMRELDRRAIEEFRVPSLTLMENAGAAVVRELVLRWDPAKLALLVCCGRGNNGGDGLVVARLLQGRCAALRVLLAAPKAGAGYGPEVEANLKRALAAGVRVETLADAAPQAAFDAADLIVDALLGTGSAGRPAGVVAAMIEAMLLSGRPVLAVDLPSGLSADTGLAAGPAVKVALTVMLGLPKVGLIHPSAREYVGELRVVDIGLPLEIIPRS